jgi:hypothetical protein
MFGEASMAEGRSLYNGVMRGMLLLLLVIPALVVLYASATGQEDTRPGNHAAGLATSKQPLAAITPFKHTTSRKDSVEFKAVDLCFDIEHALQSLVPYTATRCIPSFDADGLSLIVVSAKPIFSLYGAKKAWLSSLVGIVGKALDDHRGLIVNHVYVSDGALLARHQAYGFPAWIAQDLQHKVNQLTGQAHYQNVTDALREYAVPAKGAGMAALVPVQPNEHSHFE